MPHHRDSDVNYRGAISTPTYVVGICPTAMPGRGVRPDNVGKTNIYRNCEPGRLFGTGKMGRYFEEPFLWGCESYLSSVEAWCGPFAKSV